MKLSLNLVLVMLCLVASIARLDAPRASVTRAQRSASVAPAWGALIADGYPELSVEGLRDGGDREELAHALYATGGYQEAAALYGSLYSETGDPLMLGNLAAAMCAMGADALHVYCEALAATDEHDAAFSFLLEGLAREYEEIGESEHAVRIFAHAEDLVDMRDQHGEAKKETPQGR